MRCRGVGQLFCFSTSKTCCFGEKLYLGGEKNTLPSANGFKLTLCKSMRMHTHKRTLDWNAVLAAWL